MNREDLKVGAVVRHFKYETLSEPEKVEKKYLYEIVGLANHTENEEELVIYRALYGEFGIWVRPLSMWNETVIHEGREVKRFTYIGEE